ncbi:MAG: 4-hydroxybenzoate polyprenyltransferase and related prenyltransferase [Chthoniobacteraceae bacterium]|nr:4-hydroxybenzoate polyprenyltransferase and related prenyltransferase [Chthoniobacteraceae bacterium]
MNKWWIYQRERFPILAHGPLIAAFSLSAVSFSALLRGSIHFPDWRSCLVAFITSLFFFLQLRIADEFKDFEEDSLYRPYRPVPRGLISLRELGWLWALTAAIQAGLALWLKPALIWVLAIAWAYLFLMTQEFFARDWLKARPVTYLWTHMLIMPLVDLYATACDWTVAGASLPRGLIWFLIVSFFNGIVIEIGRKIRAPQDEEPGVPTYSAQWGAATSIRAWLLILVATAASASIAATHISFARPILLLLTLLVGLALIISLSFLRSPKSGKRFELFAGVWTLTMYLALGAVPMLIRTLCQ